jgi:hypothetical protein
MKTKFNKRFLWMMAAILTLCGAVMLSSCSKDDDNGNGSVNELNVKEKIIGKWMPADKDGQPMITNKKMSITFTSPTKAYMSASLNAHPEAGSFWTIRLDGDVVINNDKVVVTAKASENEVVLHEYIINDINDKELTANHRVTYTVDGKVELFIEDVVRYVKQTADYKQDIIGLWECTGLSGIETYNDANARLEFATDGTYKYWQKNDFNVWNAVTTREFQNYFVDGTLLATRWKDQGDAELREWWEIESITNDEMTWKALRQNEEGENVVQRMTWKKVDN